MALARKASSPMNFVLMRLEIQPSVITSPVLVAILAAGPVTGTAAGRSMSATQAKPSDQELSSLIAMKIANDKLITLSFIVKASSAFASKWRTVQLWARVR